MAQDGTRQNGDTRLIKVRRMDLRVTDAKWAFAERNAADIASHWAQRAAENPHYFNGSVLMLSDFSLTNDGCFSGRFLRTDFRSFLYWRETGQTDTSVCDTVGTALIRTPDDTILLCQQRAGHLNTGLTTPPGGFIDARDVNQDGTIDIARAVAREVIEETGLGPPLLQQGAGYLIAIAGSLVSIAVPWTADVRGAVLVSAAMDHVASEADGELERVLAVPPATALETLNLPAYARLLLGAPELSKTTF